MDLNCENWIKLELVPKLMNDGICNVPWDTQGQSTKIVNVEISCLNDGIATNCFKIKITLTDDSGDQCKDFGFILKMGKYWTFRINNPNKFFFNNEFIAYTELFPALGWTDYLPKCYYFHVKNDIDIVIVFEDFTYNGYRMPKDKGKLSLEHIYETVKLLGKFHGLSYALKHSNPNKFNEIRDKFQEGKYYDGFDYVEPYSTIYKNHPNRAIQSIQEHPNEGIIPDNFLKAFKETIGSPIHYEQKVHLSHNEPLATFTHGDFLRNNLAFKYREYGNEDNVECPIDAIMFDFQTIRYGSPMADLVIFFALSTSVDVRPMNFDNIFDLYYNTMVECYCKKMNIKETDIPDFLSRFSLLMEYGRLLPLGFANTYFLSWCLSDEPVDFNWVNHVSFEEAVEQEFIRGGENVNRELRALIREMYQFYQKYGLCLPFE